MRRWLGLMVFATLAPTPALAQSAGEVERCFQYPMGCSGREQTPANPQAVPRPAASAPAAPHPAPAAPAPPAATAGRAAAPPPDHLSVLQSPEAERRKLQESLRTLDKYNGPIDGNLTSDATEKAIGDWQKGRGTTVTGKLTPAEAGALNAEAARVPIRRIDPASQVANATPTPLGGQPRSNAEALKALQSRVADRRKAAEPKANAATQALIRDLKAYVSGDGKGVAGGEFPAFAKWYAETKAAGRTVGTIVPAVEDYGDAKSGAAATAEVVFETGRDGSSQSQCLVFAWIEATPRKNAQAFSCDDVAAVEKWKTDQLLRSAWR